jgi:LacI family fructose operon transcriptional repressor
VLIEHGEAFSRECGQQLMEELLQRLGHLPDALVTTSYVLLQGVFDALHDFPLKSRRCAWAPSVTRSCWTSCHCRSTPWPSNIS